MSADVPRERAHQRRVLNLLLIILSAGAIADSFEAVPHLVSSDAIAFLAALAVVTMLGLRLPQGDTLVIDAAVSVAAILLFDPSTAVMLAAIGSLLGSFVAFEGQPRAVPDVARRAVVVYVVATMQGVTGLSVAPPDGAAGVVSALAVGAMYMILDLGSYGLLASARTAESATATLRGIIRSVGWLHLGQVCLGIVLALVHRTMGAWGVAVITVLSLILLNAFNMYLRARVAYSQTIDALVRAQALGSGAGLDVHEAARLSVLVGRRLGLHGRTLERLRYATLLQDIGTIGNALDASSEKSPIDHASRGAAILREIPFLTDTARIVEAHHSDVSQLEDLSIEDRRLVFILQSCSTRVREHQAAMGDVQQLDSEEWLRFVSMQAVVRTALDIESEVPASGERSVL